MPTPAGVRMISAVINANVTQTMQAWLGVGPDNRVTFTRWATKLCGGQTFHLVCPPSFAKYLHMTGITIITMCCITG